MGVGPPDGGGGVGGLWGKEECLEAPFLLLNRITTVKSKIINEIVKRVDQLILEFLSSPNKTYNFSTNTDLN